jgi:hypothetical protein
MANLNPKLISFIAFLLRWLVFIGSCVLGLSVDRWRPGMNCL